MPASWIWIWSRLLGGEHVDDAVEGLRGVVGVQRGEHEVTGLGERERDRDRVEVAHLAEEDDVGVLTQGAAQTVGEAVHVGAHLTLVDHRGLVVVQVLDRVLDGEDVAPASVSLMRSIIAASVVLLPEPVGPTTSTRPYGRVEQLDRRRAVRRAPRAMRTRKGMTRRASA